MLVLHAWWGLNDTMKGLCTRLGDAGFTTFAPDLFHGKVARTIAEADALSTAHDGDNVKTDVREASMFLRERADPAHGGLAVIGFSFGAYYAIDLSCSDPEHVRSVVLFYGTGPGNFSASKAEYLGHFAENDEYEPRPGIDRFEETARKAGCPVTFHHYPGTGHWFFEPDRPDAYDPVAASLAWERTLEFLVHVNGNSQ